MLHMVDFQQFLLECRGAAGRARQKEFAMTKIVDSASNSTYLFKYRSAMCCPEIKFGPVQSLADGEAQ